MPVTNAEAHQSAIKTVIEASIGAMLAPSMFWTTLLHEVNFAASLIASICGAVIGMHGVYRIYRRYRPEPPPPVPPVPELKT